MIEWIDHHALAIMLSALGLAAVVATIVLIAILRQERAPGSAIFPGDYPGDKVYRVHFVIDKEAA